MPDITNTSYYCYAKFSNIPQTSLKNVPYCGESFLDFASQLHQKVCLPFLNLKTLELGARNELVLQEWETHQKEIYTCRTDINLHGSHPEQTVICGKPNTKHPNRHDLKYAGQLPEKVKPVSPVQNYGAEEPTDGSSTSKSSSSCNRSDISHSSIWNMNSRKNSRASTHEVSSAGNSECHKGGRKPLKKGAIVMGPQGKHPTHNSKGCTRKNVPCEDESIRRPHKVFNSECLRCNLLPATGSSKQYSEKPGASAMKFPHEVASHIKPHQNSKQNSKQSQKAEVDNNVTNQGDTSKYDDTARLEIFKLRHRIKRYTEGLESPKLRKSHTFHTQNSNSPCAKILKSKIQPVPDCRNSYQGLSCSKCQSQCTKNSPLIQKGMPQMLHTASVRKKRRNFEICYQRPETRTGSASCTTSSDVSSTASDCQSGELSSDVSNRMEPCGRNRNIRYPMHIRKNIITNQNEKSYDKSVPQHALARNQTDTTECCTKQNHRNSEVQPIPVKRNQLRRPVPGQRPLYNYDQLSYQACEVYPDLICELEEKLAAMKSQDPSGKSVGPLSKHRLKKYF